MKTTTHFLTAMLHALAALTLAVASFAAKAQAKAIESVNLSPASGGKIGVKVTQKDAPASAPAG